MKGKILIPVGLVILVAIGVLLAPNIGVIPNFVKEFKKSISVILSSEVISVETQTEKFENGEIIYFNETLRGGSIESYAHIKYFLEGKEYEGPFYPEARPALDWIKNNTEKNATFLCWLTEALMIEGYTQRKIIARDYSLEASSILWPGIFEVNIEHFKERGASNETMRDIVRAFSSTNINDTITITKKYRAQYVFVMKNQYYWDIFTLANKFWGDPFPGPDNPFQ